MAATFAGKANRWIRVLRKREETGDSFAIGCQHKADGNSFGDVLTRLRLEIAIEGVDSAEERCPIMPLAKRFNPAVVPQFLILNQLDLGPLFVTLRRCHQSFARLGRVHQRARESLPGALVEGQDLLLADGTHGCLGGAQYDEIRDRRAL